jgi:hypothetical protein
MATLNCTAKKLCSPSLACESRSNRIDVSVFYTDAHGIGAFFGHPDVEFRNLASVDPRFENSEARLEDATGAYVLGYEAATGYFRLYSITGINHEIFQMEGRMLPEAGVFIEMACEGSLPW